ncbi:MAG: hypothetical protein GX646_06430 [Bacteroidales bacterium]|nr:hypothetical protein [Bacteroidales bacterium]
MEKYIEVNDRRYYYRDGGTYTETGELVPEGEALVLHFQATGRTPLTTGEYTQLLKDVSFKNFDLFLDNLPEAEQRDQVRIAIESLKERIKFLSKTSLAGGERIKTKVAYEKQIEALELRLQGTTAKNWDSLRQSLIGEYIEEVSLSDFDHVMNHHHLPNKGKPITWIGTKADATRFYKKFQFKQAEFNKCFVHKDGKPFLTKNATDTHPSERFDAILNNA